MILAVACAAPAPDGAVTILEYGRTASYSARAMVGDAPEGTRRPLSWQVWLVRTPDRLILVDTGFVEPSFAAARRVEGFVPVADALRSELGVDPSAVTDVVITHGHWDHAGGVAAFPDARVWVQAATLDWMRARGVATGAERSGVWTSDLAALEAAPHLQRLDGDAALGAFVTARRGGGHTPGMMWVAIASEPPVAIVSDVAYVAENVARGVPPGGSADPGADRELLRTLAGWTVIAGHDPGALTGGHHRVVPLAFGAADHPLLTP